jgi:uncharacterized protein
MIKPVVFCFGWIFFGLGIIGAFLPLLPTTPFLLLAAYCFSKTSPRFHTWLLEMPIFGPAVIDWNQNRVIRLRAKLLCCSMLLISLFFIWIGERPSLYIKVPVTVLMIGVGLFVATRASEAKPD